MEFITKNPPSPNFKINLQKRIYNCICSNWFGNNISYTFRKRLTNSFSPYTLDFSSSVILEECFRTLREGPAAVASKVVKCWTNGWATSRRYHEQIILPCLFGCPNSCDDLYHYLQCPHLLALWAFLAGGVSKDPLVRWGLINPSQLSFNYIACAFSGYHAVRREFKKLQFFNENLNILCGAHLRKSWSVFADSFIVEARELAVLVRKFSLPEFLMFINAPGDNSCASNVSPVSSVNDNNSNLTPGDTMHFNSRAFERDVPASQPDPTAEHSYN